ncbi:MAG: histidine kinase dimerization/phospho-acceptor domain-containing protein, partial [Gammaproteobacteria bacterium]
MSGIITLLAIAVFALCISIYLFSSQLTEQELSTFIISLSVVSVLALLLIAVAGFLISIFVVTRINRIADTAHEIIITGDLTKRLEVDSKWDDLSFLASVLNEMLEKIETLMTGVQHITDTVAHDLRTPLARLRNKLERVSLESNTHEQNIQETISPLVREVDRLLKTFNALLSLSSLESGRQSLKFETFDLEKVLMDAIDLYTPLAEEKNQAITVNTKPVD